MEPATRTTFVCVGSVDDVNFHKSKALLEAMSLASVASGLGELAVDAQAMMEPEFDQYLTGAVQRLRGASFQHTGSPLITMVCLPKARARCHLRAWHKKVL